jgi:MYXO-CTERM domain-containing protein
MKIPCLCPRCQQLFLFINTDVNDHREQALHKTKFITPPIRLKGLSTVRWVCMIRQAVLLSYITIIKSKRRLHPSHIAHPLQGYSVCITFHDQNDWKMKRLIMLFGVVMLSFTTPAMAQDGGTATTTTTTEVDDDDDDDDDDGDKGLWGLVGLAGLLGLLRRDRKDHVHVEHRDTTRR